MLPAEDRCALIVIHIGLKKAGSSSIQAFLSGNEQALRKISLEYPRIGRLDRWTHQNLASEIQHRKRFDPAYGTISELADYWRGAPARIMIVSSEMFEEADREEISHLKNTLSRSRENEEFRIILIIRELIDLMPSSYAQKIKFGENTYNFDDFFRKRMQERRVNYFATANRWADVFGWECVCVRLLDRRHLLNGDLLDDFLSVCNVETRARAIPSIQLPPVANVSPGWRVTESIRALFNGSHGLTSDHPLMEALRQIDRKTIGKQAMLVGERREWNTDRGHYLTRMQADRCHKIYKRAIEKFNQLLPESLPLPLSLDARGFADRDFLPGAEHIPKKELLDFYDDLAELVTNR